MKLCFRLTDLEITGQTNINFVEDIDEKRKKEKRKEEQAGTYSYLVE